MINKLYDILMCDDVVISIKNNLDIILNEIPELKSLIGFQHKHPHHHLDVWEHTLLAICICPKDFDIRLVLLLHDIGNPYSYQDKEVRHFYGHAKVSADISFNIFQRLKISNEKISKLCYLIEEHDTPITNYDIDIDKELTILKFKIQCCDALAHNPLKLEKRISYLLNINEIINDKEESIKCKKLISKFRR